MTNKTELLPCPFCSTQPALPDGDGTQYEISCEDCGGAVASVQICDLMTLEERASDSFEDYRYGEEFVERAKLEAIGKWNTRAPAEDVRAVAEEPVAPFYISLDDLNLLVRDDISAGRVRLSREMRGVFTEPLFTNLQRSVVLPARRGIDPNISKTAMQWSKDCEWNACLDAVEELNK